MRNEPELELICKRPNRRPRQTQSMARQAAELVADELIRCRIGESGDRDGIIADILAVTRFDHWMDGYEIARALEERHHWTCDLDTAELLDMFSTLTSGILRDAEIRWARENPMDPPYPTGTQVQTRHGTGVIMEVFAHAPHSFVVQVGDKRIILPFEEVKPT